MGKDLKTSRATHISAPLNTGDVEFHLQNQEIKPPKDYKDGKSYWVQFPVQGTSKDDKGHRYKSVGLPSVMPRTGAVAPLHAEPKLKQRTQVHKSTY